jgi:hypothetical protein
MQLWPIANNQAKPATVHGVTAIFHGMEIRDGRRWPKGNNREQALRTYIMASIADDYEELKLISTTVSEWAEGDGLKFDNKEIIDQLSALIRADHVQAYILSPRAPHVVAVDFSEACANDLWFMLTASGQQELDKLDAG